jgi:hypothetical protein
MGLESLGNTMPQNSQFDSVDPGNEQGTENYCDTSSRSGRLQGGSTARRMDRDSPFQTMATAARSLFRLDREPDF